MRNAWWLGVLLWLVGGLAHASHDLTKGDKPDDKHDWNLGVTGARGWIFAERLSTQAARQILITSVDQASPAQGLLEAGDVLLGVGTQRFSSDARLALGAALTAAEAGNGRLQLLRWRAGVESRVELRIPKLGAYSDTAPLTCAKSQHILQAALRHIAARGLKGKDVDDCVAALALLAGAVPEHRAQVAAFAKGLAARSPGESPPMGMTAWEWGWAGIVLAEYQLASGDTSFREALRAYALAIARGQSGVGTWGHGMALPNEARSLGGYGALNQAGLGCWLAMILAQRCGVADPSLTSAIERSANFFRFYVDKGSIPYGDHPPFWELHDNNGKNGQAAIGFALLGDRPAATFFARMSIASYAERELGHTGNYFGYLWGLLGVAGAGPKAWAAHLAEQRSYFDLARRADGSFPYPGAPGEEDSYAGWDATAVFALAYAAPLRTLELTKVQIPLSDGQVREAIECGRDWHPAHPREAYSAVNTEDLLQRLGSWSPVVRYRAAQALARRSDAVIDQLIVMLDGNNSYRCAGACQALEFQAERAARATEPLLRLLQHSDPWIQIRAAYALAGIGKAARQAVPALLRLANSDPQDARASVRRYLCLALFLDGYLDNGPKRGLLADSLDGVDRDLLFPAIERMLRLDDGLARSSVSSLYPKLSAQELQRLTPAIRESIRVPAPSGEMFADGVRLAGLEILARNQDPQGMQLALAYARTQNQWGSENRMSEILATLTSYGAQALPLIPELESLAQACREELNFPDDCKQKKVAAVEAAIRRLKALRTVRVFVLAGQSNMQGPAVADLAPEWNPADYNHGRGSLAQVLREPGWQSSRAHLVDSTGKWAQRSDVQVRYQLEDGPLLRGPLSVGFSPHGPHHFGPELEFGHVLGEHYTEPVLIIKTAWGGKSLYSDFRPPSSGGSVGPYYTRMLAEIRAGLAELEGQAVLSGLVWYQGWNDGCDPERAVPEYEANLVNLIQDLRRDLQAPQLPVVIGELTGPWVVAEDGFQQVRLAQKAAAERCGARFVATHSFVRAADASPHPGHGHHEFGNAETYLLIGRAFGTAMLGM